jgi:SOS response associated peptidase (SRAP)
MAGLWDAWRSPSGKRVESFTIITTEPNELIRPVHNRMPVICDGVAIGPRKTAYHLRFPQSSVSTALPLGATHDPQGLTDGYRPGDVSDDLSSRFLQQSLRAVTGEKLPDLASRGLITPMLA